MSSTPSRSHRRHDDVNHPPSLAVPGWLDGLILGRSQTAAVYARGFACYPGGFEFDLVALTRTFGRSGAQSPFAWQAHGGQEVEVARPVLDFTVRIFDGSGHRELTPRLAAQAPVGGTGPAVFVVGGGSASGFWRGRLWVFPLPERGSVRFSCAWKAQRIPVTTHTLRARRFVSAARRAEELGRTTNS
jgi:hypothetical protein